MGHPVYSALSDISGRPEKNVYMIVYWPYMHCTYGDVSIIIWTVLTITTMITKRLNGAETASEYMVKWNAERMFTGGPLASSAQIAGSYAAIITSIIVYTRCTEMQ